MRKRTLHSVPEFSPFSHLCIANHLVPIGFTLRPRRNLAAEIGLRYRYRNFSIVFPRMHVYIFFADGSVHAAVCGIYRTVGRTIGPIQNKQLTHDTLSLSLTSSLSRSSSLPPSWLVPRFRTPQVPPSLASSVSHSRGNKTRSFGAPICG